MRIADGARSRGSSVASAASPPSERAVPSALAGERGKAKQPRYPDVDVACERASVRAYATSATLRSARTARAARRLRSVHGMRDAGARMAKRRKRRKRRERPHETPHTTLNTKYSEYDDTTLTQFSLR